MWRSQSKGTTFPVLDNHITKHILEWRLSSMHLRGHPQYSSDRKPARPDTDMNMVINKTIPDLIGNQIQVIQVSNERHKMY